jgi:hypothetical protein
LKLRRTLVVLRRVLSAARTFHVFLQPDRTHFSGGTLVLPGLPNHILRILDVLDMGAIWPAGLWKPT